MERGFRVRIAEESIFKVRLSSEYLSHSTVEIGLAMLLIFCF